MHLGLQCAFFPRDTSTPSTATNKHASVMRFISWKDELDAPKQRFAEEYLVDFDKRAAFLRVFPGAKNATDFSSRLLKLKCVQAYIAKRQKDFQDETSVSKGMIIAELRRIAFSNVRDHVKYDDDGATLVASGELTEEQAAAVSEVSFTRTPDGKTTVKFKLHPKTEAIALLGKTKAMFTDNQNVQLDAAVQFIEDLKE